MSKHTPGPWAVWSPASTPSLNPLGATFVVGPARLVMDKSSGFSLADASLIAAAPDLLEALEGMLDMYTQLVNCGDCGHWDAEKEKEVIASRSAIAKAKGNPCAPS